MDQPGLHYEHFVLVCVVLFVIGVIVALFVSLI
jgi:hypothetical protein